MLYCQKYISIVYFVSGAALFVGVGVGEPAGGGLLGWTSFPPLKSEKLLQGLIVPIYFKYQIY